MIDQYFTEVASYLSGVPAAEQEEMLQFYKEQVIESGMSVTDVEEKYGTPKQFARTIRLEYFMDMDDAPESADVTPQERTKQRTRIVGLILLCLFASPVLIPVAILVFVALGLGIFFFLMALFSIYVAVVGVLAGGIGALIAGIMLMSQSIATGIFFVGLGLLLTGLTIVMTPIILNLTQWLFDVFMQFMKWIGRRFVTRHENTSAQGGRN